MPMEEDVQQQQQQQQQGSLEIFTPPPPPPPSAATPAALNHHHHHHLLLHHHLLHQSPVSHLPPPPTTGAAATHHHHRQHHLSAAEPYHPSLDIPDASPSAKRSKYSSPSSPPSSSSSILHWSLPSHLAAPTQQLTSSQPHQSQNQPHSIVLAHPTLAALPLSPTSGPSSASATSFSQSSSPGGSAQLTPNSASAPPVLSQHAMATAAKQQQAAPGSPSASTQSPRTTPGDGAYAVNLGDSSAAAQPPPPPPSSASTVVVTATAGAVSSGVQRKGKFVSPVWKPYEMLVLAKAWRLQYTGGGAPTPVAAKAEVGSASESSGGGAEPIGGGTTTAGQGMKAKTRAEKDWEVAEYLRRHGVQRDVKTAATKWDNMLGDFRRVHEWEKAVAAEKEESGGGGTAGGRSYFVLSSAERKLHRLPASFDEDVYDEMLQYVAHHRPRSSSAASTTPHFRHVSAHRFHSSPSSSAAAAVPLSAPLLITPAAALDYPSLHHHYLPPTSSSSPSQILLHHPDSPLISAAVAAAADSAFMLPHHGDASAAGAFDPAAASGVLTEYIGGETGGAATAVHRRRPGGVGAGITGKMKRVGRIKMVWEESVQLWAAEEYDPLPPDNSGSRAPATAPPHSGRIRVDSLGFLNADQIIFLDDSFVANSVEAFERGILRGYSTDTFASGQVIKVFGRRSAAAISPPPAPQPTSGGSAAVPPPPLRDRTNYYLSCLKMCPSSHLPTLSELPFFFNEPPPREFRFPVRPDVFHDLPAAARDAFFIPASTCDIDCRSIIYEVVAPLIRTTQLGVDIADTFMAAMWDDCINRIVKVFCADNIEIIRSGGGAAEEEEERANVCGLVRQLCLWRGEESGGGNGGGGRTGSDDPAVRMVNKLLWTYGDLPYVLGYYAVGMRVTFCALSRGEQDKIVCTSLATISLSNAAERMSSMVPCWRAAQLLPMLADSALSQRQVHSDYLRAHSPSGKVVEVMVTQVRKTYPSRRRWSTAKRIYDLLAEQRIPCVERLVRSDEASLTLTFKPRGQPLRPASVDALFQALKCVCTALVSVHSMSLMHRDVRWENVMKRADIEEEWFLIDFEDAVFEEGAAAGASGAAQPSAQVAASGGQQPPPPPQQPANNAKNYYYPNRLAPATHAPEMCRGAHGVKVDVWGLGHLIQTCGLSHVPEPLKELQRRLMDPDPDQRPSIDESFFLLMQLSSSLPHFHHHHHQHHQHP